MDLYQVSPPNRGGYKSFEVLSGMWYDGLCISPTQVPNMFWISELLDKESAEDQERPRVRKRKRRPEPKQDKQESEDEEKEEEPQRGVEVIKL